MERKEGGAGADRLLLGIDTGGTYTDAVLIDEARSGDGPSALVAQAKALTTPDLAGGIAAAVDAVLHEASARPARIALVSLSTTLATNALVEGRGGRAALVMVGFSAADAARGGLAEALGADPLIRIAGGHAGTGAEQAPLDLDALDIALQGLAVEAVAVCGHFAVRNPAHEQRARELIRDRTGLPVTCSHELSPKVGGPQRALTALLNARLIGLIERLIGTSEALLAERAIAAPLMVVRGDGALISARLARERPIETILSGPAASVVGAGWLTGLADAVVSDIGGTTTDIAVLRGGRPRLDPAGASVGGWRTMVEAAAVTTHGLGGDSEVGVSEDLDGRITLGPRRAVPVSLLAARAPEQVHRDLDRQLARETPGELDGRFAVATGAAPAGLAAPEAALLERLADGPVAADALLQSRRDRASLKRLADRGLVRIGALTPSDAAHVLGRHDAWDREAALKAARLMARRRTGRGTPLAPGAEAMAERILAQLIRRSAEVVLDAALAEDGFERPEPSRGLLAQAALDGHAGLVRPRISLEVPLVALGASAPVYYPSVAALLGARDATPPEAGVANAIGAVVAGVRVTRAATLTVPSEGCFRAHLPDGPRDFSDLDEAREATRAALTRAVLAAAEDAGAAEAEIAIEEERQEAEVEGRPMLLEMRITATASGRPRFAVGG